MPNQIMDGQAPPGQPQPGTPGGGGLPASLPAAAALVPDGLKAVAVFPPFNRPPRVDVIAAIFSENDTISTDFSSDFYSRKKRDIYNGYYYDYDRQYQTNSRPSMVQSMGGGKDAVKELTNESIFEEMFSFFFAVLKNLVKNLRCLIPRLTRRFNPGAYPTPNPYSQFQIQDYDDGFYDDPDEFNSLGKE